jgi:hypothetical protein
MVHVTNRVTPPGSGVTTLPRRVVVPRGIGVNVFRMIRPFEPPSPAPKPKNTAAAGKVARTPGCQIGYTDHTGCHQLVFAATCPTRVVASLPGA